MKRIILLMLIVSMSLCFCGCELKRTTFSKAYEYYQNEEYEEALELFETLGNFRGSDDLAEECRQKLSVESNGEVQILENTYEQISQEEAKRIIDSETGYIILDVREQYEYDEKHIPGAVLMPYESTEELAPELLPDKEQLILVYCRSGRRSKIAAQTLADMGYTNIKEFGGIIDWPYETE